MRLSANKPGECPTLSVGSSTRCDRECYTDADCRGDSKCCDSGCGQICISPNEIAITQAPQDIPRPVVHPGAQAPALEEIAQEEIDVIQPEGQVATLRCYATGYPLPTVTWSLGAIIVSIQTFQMLKHVLNSKAYKSALTKIFYNPRIAHKVSITLSD